MVFGELKLGMIVCSSRLGKFLVFVFGGVNGFLRFGLPAYFTWSRFGVIGVDLRWFWLLSLSWSSGIQVCCRSQSIGSL